MSLLLSRPIASLMFLAVLQWWPPAAPSVSSRIQESRQEDAQSQVSRLASLLRSDDEEARLDAVIELGAIATAAAAQALTLALDDRSELVRGAAVSGLGRTRDTSFAPLVIARIEKDKSVFVRKSAAYALGKLQTSQGTLALTRALRDKKEEVRGAAAYSLSQYPDASAVPDLRLALRDKNDFARAQAAHALGTNGPAARAAVPELIDLLIDDKDHLVRRQAVVALGRIGDPSALPALEQARLSADPYLSQDAAEAIRMITRPASP